MGVSDKKNKPTQMRLSEDDKTLIQAAAKLEGIPYTTWMRSLCLKEARRVIATERQQQQGTGAPPG